MGIGYSYPKQKVSDCRIQCVGIKNIVNYLSMLINHRLACIEPLLIGSGEKWQIQNLNKKVRCQIDGELFYEALSDTITIQTIGAVGVLC
jgi:hypothetical protein